MRCSPGKNISAESCADVAMTVVRSKYIENLLEPKWRSNSRKVYLPSHCRAAPTTNVRVLRLRGGAGQGAYKHAPALRG